MQNHVSSPLVSVVIITYNSAQTVLETLESIKNQTYTNIELIISDDCSKDDTVEKVRKWIENNQFCFTDVKLIESTKNTGVSPNLNRGIKLSKGKWIKSIAGDDTLEQTAIEEYVKFVLSNDCNICFAKMKTFGIDKDANKDQSDFLEKTYFYLRLPTRKQQYKAALHRHILPGPGIFYKRTFYDEIGGFNERYPLAEEYDFQLRVLEKSKIYFLDKYLVNWRIRPNSLCHSTDTPISKDLERSIEETRIPRMLKEHMYLHVWDYYIVKYVKCKRNSKFYGLQKLVLALSPLRIKYKFFHERK